MTAIAVIPARHGSKRIPGKNTRDLNGRPLITWTIDLLLSSESFTSVVVSTDHPEIAQIAEKAGALVPFLRSPDLADDLTPTVPVVADAVRRFEAVGLSAPLVCCVYPAAVLTSIDDLTLVREQLLRVPLADYGVPVVRYSHPIARALALGTNGTLSMVSPEHATTRTQDLNPCWHDSGQFYWGRREAWLDGRSVFARAIGVEIPSWRAQDLDSEDDWVILEALHSRASRRDA